MEETRARGDEREGEGGGGSSSSSSTEPSSQSLPKFKKPKRKPRLRSKPADAKISVSNDDKPADDEDEPLGAVLRETRKIQRERERFKGCEVGAHSAEVLSGIKDHGTYHVAASVHDKSKDEGALVSNFIVQRDERADLDPLMEKYVEEGLRAFREERARQMLERTKAQRGEGSDETDQQDQEEEDPVKKAERGLYETPAHLQVEGKTRSEDTISESWLTGIQEVELPMEFKLKNIEATEEARREMLKRKQERPAGDGAPKPEVINTRFQRQDVTTQLVRAPEDKKGKQRDEQSKQQQHDGPRRSDKATDEQVFERFKKRFRY